MLLALDASELNELFKNRKVGTSVFADCGLGASKFRLGYGGKQELYLHTALLNPPAYSMNSQLERQTRPVFAKVHKEASEFWEREAATASTAVTRSASAAALAPPPPATRLSITRASDIQCSPPSRSPSTSAQALSSVVAMAPLCSSLIL